MTGSPWEPSQAELADLDLRDEKRVPQPSAFVPPLLRRGQQIDAYQLNDRLGFGFSAEVWSATARRVPPGVDVAKGQRVAIKFYHPHTMVSPDQVLRVEREYRIAQALRHPHLIRIYEFMLASPRPHHNFLVMDLAEGELLSDVIARKRLPSKQVLIILAQLLSALDELHSAGARHRDVKPSNIFVSLGDRPKTTLLDLGIVSVTHEKGITAVSRFVGSKHWAPLEQLVGGALDERSDLYSVAAVVYNALTQREPFSDRTTEAAVAVEMHSTSLSIPQTEGINSEIITMLNACLSAEPDRRPARARQCLAVLKKHGIQA